MINKLNVIFRKVRQGKRLPSSNDCVKVIYFVSDHRGSLQNPNSGGSQAGSHRVNYMLNIIADHFSKNDIYCVSTASWKNSRIFRAIERPNDSYDNVTEVYLGQIDLGPFRYISSTFSAMIWLITHLDDGDILITYNFTPPTALFAWFTMLLRKYKLIIEFEELYGLIGTSRYKKLFLVSENYGVNKSSGFITCSEEIAKRIRCSRGPTSPIAISSGYFGSLTFPTARCRNGNRLCVLYSGTLDDERGVRRLIDTMVDLKDIADLTITGTGPLRDYIVKRTRLCENIRYLGNLSEDMYQQTLAEADVCINPTPKGTAFSQHSFPSKVTYYLSHSKIVLSTKLDVIQSSPYNNMVIYYDDTTPNGLREALIYIQDHLEQLSEKSEMFPEEIANIRKEERSDLCNLFKYVCNGN